MNNKEEQKLIVELHDVSPAFLKETKAILFLLSSLNIAPVTLLVIPNYLGKFNIYLYKDFLDIIKRYEVAIHGYVHYSKKIYPNFLRTSKEGEFYGLSFLETLKKVENSVEIFKLCDLPTKHFVPPAWINNKFLPSILRAKRCKTLADNIFIYNLAKKKKIFCPALTLSNREILDSLSRNMVRAFIPIYKAFNCFRVALHTKDARSKENINFWIESLESLVQKRRLIGYDELLWESRLTPSLKVLR